VGLKLLKLIIEGEIVERKRRLTRNVERVKKAGRICRTLPEGAEWKGRKN